MRNEFLYEVTLIQPLTEHVSQIFLQATTARTLHYQAGQYVNIIHQDQSVSPLSIACAPNASQTLEFHLFHPPQNALARDLLRLAQEEKIWYLSGPFGSCTPNRLQIDKPIIFLARGTGFASVKAVIEALIQNLFYPSLILYWSLQKPEDIYLTNMLDAWEQRVPDFSYTPVFYDLNPSAPRLLQEKVLQFHTDLANYQAYVSGSPAFVQAMLGCLERQGLKREWFLSDGL